MKATAFETRFETSLGNLVGNKYIRVPEPSVIIHSLDLVSGVTPLQPRELNFRLRSENNISTY